MSKILDEVRKAILEKNSEDAKEAAKNNEKAESFKLASYEEDKVKEFETRTGEVEDIIKKLEENDIDTKEIKKEIKELVKDIT